MKELYIYTNEGDEQYNVSKEKVNDVQTIDTILVPDLSVDLICEEQTELVQDIIRFKIKQLDATRNHPDYKFTKERGKNEIKNQVSLKGAEYTKELHLDFHKDYTRVVQANIDTINEIIEEQNSLT